MLEDFVHARIYVAPTTDSFWKWDEIGHAISWKDGETIAFRTEVAAVLRRLVAHGFPHFDAIVLFLAACRAPGTIGGVELEKRGVLPSLETIDRDSRRYRDLLQALEAISAISHSIRTTLEGKVEMAAMLFESGRVVEPADEAAVILRELEAAPPCELSLTTWLPRDKDVLVRLAPLAAGAHRLAPDRLTLRQKTGLEQLPEPAPVKDAPPESLRALIARLEADEELGGLARLTTRLLAALTLPRAVSEPQDLPLGGVSDIANRGSLDRLLVSELAHDDLTFTVRVALSEALYLRREAPPRVPPQHRLVLVDSGLRMWGLPRVFGTAAALALAVSNDKRAQTTVYRARGSHLDVVDLATREGLVSHLASLETESHPGAALPVLHRLASDDDPATEVVLITCQEVLADRAFERLLQESELPVLHVVTVSRSGELRLVRRTQQGSKLLREIRCPLEEILAPKRGVTPLVDRDIDPSLPAILRIDPFPLRLPHQIDPQRLWGDAESGALQLTTDGRLLHWNHPGWGPRQLSDTLPSGKLHWHDPRRSSSNRMTAVVGRLQQGELYLLHVDLDSGKCWSRRLALQHANPQAVAGHAGAVFVIFADRIEVFSAEDSQPVESRSLPKGMTWMRDRFFIHPEGAYALSFDGRAAVFEKVCGSRAWHESEMIGLFDLVGADGPVCVSARGEVHRSLDLIAPTQHRKYFAIASERSPRRRASDASQGISFPLPRGGPFRLGAISGDGHRIVLLPATYQISGRGEQSWLLELGRNVVEVWYNPEMAAAGTLLKGIAHRPLRHRFASTYVDDGQIVLVGSSQRTHCRLTFDKSCRGIRLQPETAKSGGQRIPFVPTPSPPKTSYRLSVAHSEYGSRVYLDSRGLLHLKSCVPAIPELTLVLTEGMVAGWCANGGLFGPGYFTGDTLGGGSPEHVASIVDSVLRNFAMQVA
jgi:hypothetical protein